MREFIFNQGKYNMERKGLYGSLAGFTASVTLQPLQNIKMCLLVPPKQLQLSKSFFKDVILVSKFLYNDNGYKTFYRGLIPNVTRTALSSCFFFPTLRICENLSKKIDETGQSKLIPFLSSLTARIFSCFISNPLSVIQTRFEYGGSERWHGGILNSLKKLYQGEGIKGFWQGGLATAYKQGLFAGAYYTLYQEGKAVGLNPFIAGMIAGMISTSFTHPFEIVRAEIQSYILTNNQAAAAGIGRQVKILLQSGEAFRGLAPRVIKKPLTNTMAFVIFQMMQKRGHEES